MKPDGVDTAAPMEALAPEPTAEGPPAEEEELQPAAPPTQPEDAAERQEQPPETVTAPPAPKEGNGKPADPKAKTKGPVKTRPATTGAKGPSGPGARPGAAANRLVNGAQKPLANGLAKKTSAANAAAPEKKKLATSAAAPSKRPAGVASAPPVRPPLRAPVKVADRKPVGATRPTTAPPTGTSNTKTAAAGSVPANKKAPAAPSNGVKAKPNATAPRPASAAPSKPSTATMTKTDRPAVPKATRPAGVPLSSRAAPAATAAKASAASAKPASSRAGAAAPPPGRSGAVQPTKTTAPAKKDVSRPATAPVRKPIAPPTRPPAAKPSKPEPSKPTAAARPDPTAATKRPATGLKAADAKPSRPKPQDGKPPAMAEVKASPRAAASPRPGLGKVSSPSPRKAVGAPTPLSVKRGSKPTQSVQPLSASGEPAKKTHPAGATAAAVTAAAIATAAVATAAAVAVVEAEQPPLVEPPQPAAVEREGPVEARPCPATGDSEEAGLPALQPEAGAEPLAAIVAPLSPPPSPPPSPASPVRLSPEPEGPPPASTGDLLGLLVDQQEQEVEARREVLVPVAAVAPVSQAAEPEAAVSVAAAGSLVPEREEAVEKADEEINEDEEEREEEREGGQQASDVSGPWPTAESQLGSAVPPEAAWTRGALPAELNSEDVSVGQQGVPEISTPPVLADAGSADFLGDASLKGAAPISPDVEKLPDIPANDEDDDEDQVDDMDVGSERAEHPHRLGDEGEEEEEDEDVEMASEGVTESGLESYGNADEDDLAEDDRLDNLNRAQPPLQPSAPPPPAQWSQSNPFADPFSQPAADLVGSPSDPWLATRSEMPTQSPAQAWLELSTPAAPTDDSTHPAQEPPSTLSGTEPPAQRGSATSAPEELQEYPAEAPVPPKYPAVHAGRAPDDDGDEREEEEASTLPADELPGGPATAPESATSTPSTSGDEASDTEGEMQINEPHAFGIDNVAFDGDAAAQGLPALEEREEVAEGDGDTPQSANSAASYGFDCTASNSNAHSAADSCARSPGIFSLENEDQLPEEAKDPSLVRALTLPNPEEQQYMLCGQPGAEPQDQPAEGAPPPQEPPSAQDAGDTPDTQAPYYSTVCEKTDNILSGNV